MEELEPWLLANNAILVQLASSSFVAITLVADTRASLSAVLRGKAPRHITSLFVFSICTAFISLIMFAGRENAGERQLELYRALYAIFILLWIGMIGAGAVAHSSYQKERGARSASSRLAPMTTVLGSGVGEEKDDAAGTFSATSCEAAMSAVV